MINKTDPDNFQQDVSNRFNMAFGLMTIIPLLICIYLVTVKFFSINILVGTNGAYFLTVIAIGLLGLLYGRMVIQTVFDKLAETSSQMKKLAREEITLNEQLLEEIQKREEAQQSLKSAQEQLIQSAKMESVGQLAAGAAHEVKNPLAILIMGVDYLKKASLPADEKTQFMLSKMENAVRRADAVILGLLDFASPSQMEIEDANLNEVIERSIGLVKHEMDKKEIVLEREFGTDVGALPLDKGRMEQVIVNLLTNAAQAMAEKGGRICVRTYMQRLEKVGLGIGHRANDVFRIGERVAVVEIEDEGPGISEEALGKIFDPFYTTKRHDGGTGLGMAVVRSIVEMHKGLILVGNRPVGGAVVKLLLKTQREIDADEA